MSHVGPCSAPLRLTTVQTSARSEAIAAGAGVVPAPGQPSATSASAVSRVATARSRQLSSTTSMSGHHAAPSTPRRPPSLMLPSWAPQLPPRPNCQMAVASNARADASANGGSPPLRLGARDCSCTCMPESYSASGQKFVRGSRKHDWCESVSSKSRGLVGLESTVVAIRNLQNRHTLKSLFF